MKNRIESIDFIRAASVCLIIIFHFYVEGYTHGLRMPYSNALLSFGAIGVSFFISISGGGLFFSNSENFNIKTFYIKRIGTILPFYWIAYICTSIFLFLTLDTITLGPELKKLLMLAIGLDGFFVQTIPSYYIVGEWFTGFIILMYLIYPIIRKCIISNWLLSLCVFIIISLISVNFNNIISSHTRWWNPVEMWNPTARLPEFAFGMLFFNKVLSSKKTKYVIFCMSLLYALFAINTFDNANSGIKSVLTWISLLVITASIYELIDVPSAIKSIIAFIGKYAFMAFLYHHQIIYYFSRKTDFAKYTGFSFYYYAFVIIVLSFTAAYLTYKPAEYLKNIFFAVKKDKMCPEDQ